MIVRVTTRQRERVLFMAPLLTAALLLLVVGVAAIVLNPPVGLLVPGAGVIVGLVLLPVGPFRGRSIRCGLLVASLLLMVIWGILLLFVAGISG